MDNKKEQQESKLSNERFEICKKCEFLINGERCEKCGCYMPLKTKLPFMKCPEGKW